MKIEKNKVVYFHYRLFEGGTMLEDSRDGDPVPYLHGKGGILNALENELDGRSSGDVVDVTLAPEQAYGHRREGAIERIPVKYLLSKGADDTLMNMRGKTCYEGLG